MLSMAGARVLALNVTPERRRPTPVLGPTTMTSRRASTSVAAAVWSRAVSHCSYDIDIAIDQHYSAKIYTSGSSITGHVDIHAHRDVQFDEFQVALLGTSTTQSLMQRDLETVPMPFMKLCMPIRTVPADNTFAAGHHYSFPFTFVFPHQLAIGSCRHRCDSSEVREQHLRPPPTMGFWEGDDLSPIMTQIKYSISVVAVKASPYDFPVRVVDASHMIRVMPAAPEDAPLALSPWDNRYVLSRTKTIRKTYIAGKVGSLTATAAQPKAIMLSADGQVASSASSCIKLVFDASSSDVSPPKINSVSGKIVSHTYFDISYMKRLPNLGSTKTHELAPYQFHTSSKIFNLAVGELAWIKQSADSAWQDLTFPDPYVVQDTLTNGFPDRRQSQPRRPSVNTCPDTTGSKIAARHATSLDVQFTIPHNNRKVFLPTFHSCFISRAYMLEISLSVGSTFTAITLLIPIQIGVEAAPNSAQRRRSSTNITDTSPGQNRAWERMYAGFPSIDALENDNEPPRYQ